MILKILPQNSELKLLEILGQLSQKLQLDIYPVGGYVRDRLLGRNIHEIDIVVVGDANLFAKGAKSELKGHGLVEFPRFGTAFFHTEELKLEFVSARKEAYHKDSRKPVVKKTDLREDLMRRDFTINAMAMHIKPENFGEVIDPFDGNSDLKRKLIRTPLDPAETFSEDPLRMMRAARFASQLGFQIHDAALSAMQQEASRLEIVSQERITDELLKILSHPVPSIGLKILQEAGILKIIFPELSNLSGVEQREAYHHKDVFDHTLKVLDNVAQVSDNLLLRFTALVHDIGKPKVKRFIEGTGWTFHGHELAGVRMLKSICQMLKLPKKYEKYASKLTRLHMRPIQLTSEEVTDSAVRRLLVNAGDYVDDLMTLCRADITSGNPQRVEAHLANFDYVSKRMEEVEEKDRLRAFQSPVRGEEIMTLCGIKPGKEVGLLKKAIEEAILEGEIPNDYHAALEYLHKIKDEIINGSTKI